MSLAEAEVFTVPEELTLSEEFLKKYEKKHPLWGYEGFGFLIYLRTYSRKKPDGTNEDWYETVARFTQGNFNIEWDRLKKIGKANAANYKRLMKEMERFYHLAFNLVILPPGRGIWMSGTEYAKRVGDAENNCWGVLAKPQPFHKGEDPKVSFPFCFLMDQGMKGGGVGASLQRIHVSQIPAVRNKVKLRIICRKSHPDYEELLPLGVEFYDENDAEEAAKARAGSIMMRDSRQGWVLDGLRNVIDSHFDGTRWLTLDISDIRCRGSRIHGFGGEASGPSPLVVALFRVNGLLNVRKGSKLTPVECGDICQFIACAVVAGNVRRSAIILVGDKEDEKFVRSKDYSLEENKVATQWRWASNNSVDITPDTDRAVLEKMAEALYKNGEPGYTNFTLCRNYGRIIDGYIEGIDAEVFIINPCGEVPLPANSPCNLFEVNLPRIEQWIQDGLADESLYEEAFRLGTRYAYRITFRNYEWEATAEIVSRHRRLGVGITGIMDWILIRYDGKAILGFEANGDPIFNMDVANDLDRFYKAVKQANVEQADMLEANPSIKVSTVKPAGTSSLLMGCSSGQNAHWAPYMIRRVRIPADHMLVPALKLCGYMAEPQYVGQDENGQDVYDPKTLVFSFPISAPTAEHKDFQSIDQIPLREQLALVELLQTYWSDNSVSSTLTFHPGKTEEEEKAVIDEITDLLDRSKNRVKSLTMLPYSADSYRQMPYEAISREQYRAMRAEIKFKPWEVLQEAVGLELEEMTDCVGGACPIR